MGRIVFVIVLTLLLAGAAAAGTRDGRDAFHRADFATALKELEPEAAKGDPEAMHWLAKMYQAGLGVTKDLHKAADLFARAAREGNHEAQYSYGVALVLGEGVAQDLVEGLKWLFVAERGNNDQAKAYIEQLSSVLPRRTVARARKAAFAWHARHGKSNQPMPPGLVRHPG